MTVPVTAPCRHRPYKGVTPTANLAKKIIEISTLQFWLETSRFWQIFPASRFGLIFSQFLKLFLSLFNQSFYLIVCCFSGVSQPLSPYGIQEWACNYFSQGRMPLEPARGLHLR